MEIIYSFSHGTLHLRCVGYFPRSFKVFLDVVIDLTIWLFMLGRIKKLYSIAK